MPFREAWLPVGILLLLIGYGAAQPPIAGVGVVIMVIGGFGRYWHRHLFDRVRFERRLSERRVFVNEPVLLDIELENRKVLPLPWFEWEVAIADPLRIDDERMASQTVPGFSYLNRRGAIGWYEHDSWQFTLRATHRGYHQVGPGVIRSADLLGIFPSQRFDGDLAHLIVFPKVYSLRDLGIPADRPFGDQKGRDRIFEDPLRIAGLREYRPGDPMKRIDWKATARSGDLRSRVYEPSATRQLYVMLNIDTLEHAWEGYLPEELERAVSVAASIAHWADEERYAVGLLANGSMPDSDRPMRIAPSRAPDQLARLLEALAVIQPLTSGDLASHIRREAGRMPLGSTIVIVASLMPQPLVGIARRLASEGHHVAIVATSDRVDPAVLPGLPFFPVARALAPVEVTP